MALSFKSENVRMSEKVVGDYFQTLVEQEIIVPDIKPDIKSIIQVDGVAVVKEKRVRDNKIELRGILSLNILYVPESASAMLYGINHESEFSHSIEINNAMGELSILSESDLEHVEFSLINSRKLSVKAVVALNVKAYSTREEEIITDIEAEDDIEVLKKPIVVSTIVCQAEDEFTVRETLEIQAGKPPIGDVLKVDAKITGNDTKAIANKIVAKGSLEICTLYTSMTDDSVHFFEYEVPFTEVLDAEGIDESMSCEIDFNIKSIDRNVREDSDGDSIFLDIEAVVGYSAKASSNIEINSVADCFAPKYDAEISKSTAKMEQILGSKSVSVNFKDVAYLPSETPRIMEVYNVITKPYVTATSIEGQKVTVEAVADTYILYLSDSEQYPVFSYKKEVPFIQTVEIAGDLTDAQIDVKLEMIHTSYSIGNSGDVDIRCVAALSVVATKSVESELITDVKLLPEAAVRELPGIVIYFVQQGDTLWNISKYYKVSQNSILSLNELSEDSDLTVGMQLLIPKKH